MDRKVRVFIPSLPSAWAIAIWRQASLTCRAIETTTQKRAVVMVHRRIRPCQRSAKYHHQADGVSPVGIRA